MDIPLSEQGSSASVISREEIAERNEAQAIDLIRYLPGLSVTTTGSRGGVTSLFIRGGDDDFNLVEIDGIPISWFAELFVDSRRSRQISWTTSRSFVARSRPFTGRMPIAVLSIS